MERVQISELGTIINLALLAATYMILQPLKAKISDLVKSLDTASTAIIKLQEMLNDERIHIAMVDESVKSAHKRIEELNHQIEDIKNRCVNCKCRGD